MGLKHIPELSTDIHVSNLVLHMDGKIKEVVDYLKMFEFEGEQKEVIETVIIKLEKI